MEGSKYTRDEARAVRRCRDLISNVRKNRKSAFRRGVKPSLEMKAKNGAMMSLLLVKTNGKYEPEVRL